MFHTTFEFELEKLLTGLGAAYSDSCDLVCMNFLFFFSYYIKRNRIKFDDYNKCAAQVPKDRTE